MRPRRERIFVLLLLLLAAVSGFILIRAMEWKRDRLAPAPPGPTSIPVPEAKRSLRIFYLSPDEENLQEELREVKAGGTVHEEAMQALSELLKGPQSNLLSPLPPGTKVRHFFLDREGTAYVDFGPELRKNHPGGSKAEILSIYSIVDTLAYNFEQIRRVQILIEGAEVDTLSGHLDLRKPLEPRLDFGESS